MAKSIYSAFVTPDSTIAGTDVTDLTDSGDTTLHYHAADRARANHTGTQTASTISDFDTEVSNNVSVVANTAKNSYPSADATKVGYISVTQAVDLDTMESDIATNNAKVSNATHTGDVTGSTVLTIANGAVDIAMLSATGTPDNTTYLRGDNTWQSLASASISDTAYTRAGWNGDTVIGASKNALSDAFYNMVRYEDADTGGTGCIFVGRVVNTTNSGNYNTFTGFQSGEVNTTGTLNAFYGVSSGYSNTTGSSCSFYGTSTGQNNVGGSRQNAFGNGALFTMATTGEDNCCFGYNSLYLLNHANAIKNCAFGNYSGDAMTQGHENNLYGYNSGGSITTGSHNTVIGSENALTTGSWNIFIGAGVDAWEPTGSNYMGIGLTNGSNRFIEASMIDGTGWINFKGRPQYTNVLGTSATLSNSSFSIEFTNATTITFRGKDSGGTERTGTITLS